MLPIRLLAALQPHDSEDHSPASDSNNPMSHCVLDHIASRVPYVSESASCIVAGGLGLPQSMNACRLTGRHDPRMQVLDAQRGSRAEWHRLQPRS